MCAELFTWGHNVENVEMTKSLLYQEWVSILSKYVYVEFRQIDFSTSEDIAKKTDTLLHETTVSQN